MTTFASVFGTRAPTDPSFFFGIRIVFVQDSVASVKPYPAHQKQSIKRLVSSNRYYLAGLHKREWYTFYSLQIFLKYELTIFFRKIYRSSRSHRSFLHEVVLVFFHRSDSTLLSHQKQLDTFRSLSSTLHQTNFNTLFHEWVSFNLIWHRRDKPTLSAARVWFRYFSLKWLFTLSFKRFYFYFYQKERRR